MVVETQSMVSYPSTSMMLWISTPDLTTMFQQDVAIHRTPMAIKGEPDSRVRRRLFVFYSPFWLTPGMIGTMILTSLSKNENPS